MSWQPIETAPEGERVLVAGWQKPVKDQFGRIAVGGYWWWTEGIVFEGVDPANPTATHWHPIILSLFPEPPSE